MLSDKKNQQRREKVKFELISHGSKVWKVFANGYGKDPPSKQIYWWNAQAKCTIYSKLHNIDLEKEIDLKSEKDLWESLQVLNEGDFSQKS